MFMASHSNVLYKIFTNERDKFKTNSGLSNVSWYYLVLILDWIESGEIALNLDQCD